MRNEYVKGAPPPGSYGYGGGYNYGGYGHYGYGGGYGGGYEGGGGGGPQRSFQDYLMMFRERIWIFIVAFFIIFSGAVLYTINKTPVYTAFARVQILREDPSAMQTQEVDVSNVVRSEEDLRTQISLMQSSTIVEGVKQRLDDEERERFMAPYRDSFTLGEKLTAEEVLARNRKIAPERSSLIVNVGFKHPDPTIAANIAQYFAEEFQQYNLNQNIDTSMKAVEDLRIRAEQQREKVEELEMKLAEYREKHNAVSISEQENIAREQLARLNEIVIENKNAFDQVATKWELIESYRRKDKKLWNLSFIANQPRVSDLLSQISKLEIERARLSKRYREKHPDMVRLQESLDEARGELEKAVQNAVDKVYASYLEGKNNFEQASQRLAEKEAEMIELSKIKVEYNSLKRELDVQQKFYQALVSRMTQENAQVNLKNPNARIVDDAAPPQEPSSPNVAMNLAAGFVGGAAIGIGLVFGVAFLDDRIKSAFDIEGAVGLPLLGIVARIKKLDTTSKAQAVASNVDRHVTESFRSIHSALKLNDQSKTAKIILTTSTVPGEGKSFVSSNLSLTFATHGEKTVLLDADLRLPNVARSLSLENEGGMLECLEQGKALDDVLVKEVYPNLDVLTSGGKSKNPTQVLNSSGFEALLAQLRDRYDRIVIDSPPLAAVSDALNLLPLVDGAMYIIKFNTVKRKTVAANVRRLWESDTPIFGAVLNNVASRLSTYYYSHYTDKAYQDYYIDAEEEESEESDTRGATAEADEKTVKS